MITRVVVLKKVVTANSAESRRTTNIDLKKKKTIVRIARNVNWPGSIVTTDMQWSESQW